MSPYVVHEMNSCRDCKKARTQREFFSTDFQPVVVMVVVYKRKSTSCPVISSFGLESLPKPYRASCEPVMYVAEIANSPRTRPKMLQN